MSGGLKYDANKAPLDLIPPRPMVEIAQALDHGRQKYAVWNWSKGIKASRLFAAMLRHLWAWWGGEDNDRESGLPHLAHVGCCLIFLMDQQHRLPEQDDRPIGLCAPAFPEDPA